MKKSLVFGIIALLAILVVLAGCQKVGEATKSISRNCTDSDGGKNYGVYGEVTACISSNRIPCTVYKDSCYGTSNKVKEYFCNSANSAQPTSYRCPGSCQNGDCISSLINATNQTR